MKSDKKKNLTRKQTVFVQEYLIHFRGAEAVKKAGFKSKRPDKFAWDLRNKKEIAAAIEIGMAEKAQRAKITQDEILENIRRLGKRAEEIDKITDALKAQELLGRHLAMFTDKIEIPGAPDAIILNVYSSEPEEPKLIEAPENNEA